MARFFEPMVPRLNRKIEIDARIVSDNRSIMSVEEISLGDELKDSFKPTSKWIHNGIDWLDDIEEYYRARATIESEYAAKLKELCKVHFDRKAKVTSKLSVGDEPQITPGSLESASVVMWTDLLTQTENISKEKEAFSKELNEKVALNLSLLKSKAKSVSKRIEGINDFLKEERSKVEQDLTKSKKHYDSLCASTESARQKTEKSTSDKSKRKLEEKETEMNIGKNDYLIKINISNRLKDKYYFQDLPELLDIYQELNEDRIAILNKILKNANIIERNSCDKVKNFLDVIDSTINQNNRSLDTIMFVKHNRIDWKEPQDAYFVPSPVWHDDESLVTKEPELTDLKRRLNAASASYSQYQESGLDLKQLFEESTEARNKNKNDVTLKFDTELVSLLALLNKFMQNDSSRVKAEVEIEVIQNFAGDQDLSYTAQPTQKKSRFGLFKGKSSQPVAANSNSDAQSIYTSKSASSHHTIPSGIFNLRNGKKKSDPTCRALFSYTATGDDEMSMNVGDELNLIAEDDGSGWTMIESNGQSGLVPTTYLDISKSDDADNAGGGGFGGGMALFKKKKGPAVTPKRGAKKIQYVEALYDYVADGLDELSISTGDKIVLIKEDVDGSGWTEGEINGSKGLFPSTYVRRV